MSVTNVNGASGSPNPFNLQPQTATQTAGSSFDEQLSSALSESLRRVGLSTGEVNITIRNTGASASARQIMITYNAPAASAAAARIGITAGTPSESTLTVNDRVDTAWAPYDGPRDRRDGIPVGGGRLSSSGAPDIRKNSTPTANQYNYTGHAAFNPYFTTPSNPLRPGYVAGFENWFRDASVYGGITGPMPANKMFFATEEGAQEALRLVREYEAEATVTTMAWGGGPYTASSDMFYIKLPGERVMNAGMILSGYYHGGAGVTTSSDELLAAAFRQG
jgi:hypothetical protein